MIDSLIQNLERVFGWLIEASWQASVLVALVLLLQWIFRTQLNSRWHHALWLLVIARLLLPILPESGLSLFQFAPQAPPIILHSVTEPIFTPAPEAASVPDASILAPPVKISAHPFSFYTLFAAVWFLGAFGLLILTWQVNRRFGRHVRSAPPVKDPTLLEIAAAAQTELGLHRSLRLIESAHVQGPAIMGLIHPTLILPLRARTRFTDDELRFIFLHELAHLKRGDLVLQWLVTILQVFHWFNPVLWYAFRRMRVDREPATDALVLSRTGEAEKYGNVLIKLLEHYHQRHSLPTLVGILEDKDQFKRRFALIGQFTRGAYGWSLLGVIIIGVLAIACLTQGNRTAFKRDPALPYVIDLKPFYGRFFKDPAGADSEFKGYVGRKIIDGLPFDIAGERLLYGKENADRDRNFLDALSGIKIGRKFDELHLVHAAEWREYHGCPVATLRLHYTDGTVYDFIIRYDLQVIDLTRLYTENEEIIADPDTKIIWRGAGAVEGTGRLFKSVLRNPFPDKKVDAMDIISTRSGSSYVLIAATVAQSEPGREVTPPIPLLPSRNFGGQLKLHIVDKKTGAPLAGAEVYPAMIIGDISLVADNVLTGADGNAVVKYPTDGISAVADPNYPKGGAKDLRVKVCKAGYVTFDAQWENGWQADSIPDEITYRLTPEGYTTVDDTIPDFTVKPSEHPNLLAAVRKGDAAMVQQLIDKGDDPKALSPEDHWSLLFDAGSAEVAELLISHGVDPKAPDKYGNFPLEMICANGNKNAAAVARVLLQHGADPNSRTGPFKETPLMVAHDGGIVDVLVEYGADLKATDSGGYGVLFRATQTSLSQFEALIRHGVPFNAKTDGPTLLVQASWVDNSSIVQWLLDHRVDPNVPGLYSRDHGQPDFMEVPMQAAAIAGHADIAKLLLAHGAKADDQMITALHNRQNKIVKLLWESGARNISELCYAVSQGAPTADLQRLLDHGIPADPPQDKMFSPLTIAAQLGNMDAVKLLIQRGADVNKTAIFNPEFSFYTVDPLTMAASEGQDEIVEYLLQHGATPGPVALWQAADNSYPYQNQRSKDHFEKTVRILLDAGALKNATPEEQGYIVYGPIQTRQGPPNATVLKMILDTGGNPNAPMPYIVKNGEKPNSVIGYFRDYYAKQKDDPSRSGEAAQIKPLLDMLEAAVGGAKTGDMKGSGDKPGVSAMTAYAVDTLVPATADISKQIIEAVKKDDATALAKLVDGINVSKILDGDEPLLFSARSPDVAKILLEHGADPNARWGDNGDVPLFSARNAAMVGLLIADGADPKLKSNNGNDALDYVGWQDPSVFEALIRGGVPFDVQVNGPDKLVEASDHGNIPLMTKLLDLGVDPNKSGVWFRDGPKVELMTPLNAAVNSGQVSAVTLLLDHGVRTEGDKAKIMVIAVEAHPAIAKLLWSRGNRDVSPLLYAINQGASVQEITKMLDAGSPADPPQDKDLTPLGAVVEKGNLDAVKLLVERGADVNKCSHHDAKDSNTPLALAAFAGRDEMIAYLLQHGAKPDPTALYEAAHNSTPYNTERPPDHFEKVVRLLLDAGALKNATPEEQGSIVSGPIWTRQGPPNATVLKMILDAGGNPNAPVPFTKENGEKPNTVIGYYRDYCAQHKEDPNFGTGWEKIKPLLDMLEEVASASAKTSGTYPIKLP